MGRYHSWGVPKVSHNVERKGKERKGKERKGKEREGKGRGMSYLEVSHNVENTCLV